MTVIAQAATGAPLHELAREEASEMNREGDSVLDAEKLRAATCVIKA